MTRERRVDAAAAPDGIPRSRLAGFAPVRHRFDGGPSDGWPSRVLTPLRIRAVRDGLSVLGVIALVWVVLYAHPDDVHAYWSFSLADPYGSSIGGVNAFLYSPVAALLVLPLHVLPFEVVRLLLVAADVACLLYLAGSWGFALLALPPVFADVAAGNIHILLGTAIAVGFRYPATWAFVLLTKVTPGVGVLWFAVRREWRNLALAAGVAAALAVASVMLVPGWWPAWIASLRSSTGSVVTAPVLTTAPLVVRLVASAVLVAWGAWSGRRWTVPLAAVLALPAVWVMGSSMLIGAIPYPRRGRRALKNTVSGGHDQETR